MNNSMNLLHLEPWSVADLLASNTARAPGRRSRLLSRGAATSDWAPAMDIVEKQDRFQILADLPGVSAEDIDVSMENGVLTISGQRTALQRDEDDGVQRIERAHGKFARRFAMPESANAEGISAKTSNGILEVSIPKQPEQKARRISVETA